MACRAELLQVLDDVCADVRENAIGAAEVAERLVVTPLLPFGQTSLAPISSTEWLPDSDDGAHSPVFRSSRSWGTANFTTRFVLDIIQNSNGLSQTHFR